MLSSAYARERCRFTIPKGSNSAAAPANTNNFGSDDSGCAGVCVLHALSDMQVCSSYFGLLLLGVARRVALTPLRKPRTDASAAKRKKPV